MDLKTPFDSPIVSRALCGGGLTLARLQLRSEFVCAIRICG